MSNYGIASYDAIHAATAIESDTQILVTIDAGFGSLPEEQIELYVDASRVSSCRRRRR